MPHGAAVHTGFKSTGKGLFRMPMSGEEVPQCEDEQARGHTEQAAPRGQDFWAQLRPATQSLHPEAEHPKAAKAPDVRPLPLAPTEACTPKAPAWQQASQGEHPLVGKGLQKLLAMDEIPAWLQGPAADGNSWFCRMCGNWADHGHLTSLKGKHQKKLNNGVGELPDQWYGGMDVENMTNSCKARDVKLFEDGFLDKQSVAEILTSSCDDDSPDHVEPAGRRLHPTPPAHPPPGRLGLPIISTSRHHSVKSLPVIHKRKREGD